MVCERCQYSFCWGCMRELNNSHRKWYRLCPEIPYSYCTNMLMTILFFIFLPVIVFVCPILAAIVNVGCLLPCALNRRNGKCCKIVTHLIFFLLLMPLAVALAAVAAALVGAVVIIPLYYYTLLHLFRLIYIGCRFKLC